MKALEFKKKRFPIIYLKLKKNPLPFFEFLFNNEIGILLCSIQVVHVLAF